MEEKNAALNGAPPNNDSDSSKNPKKERRKKILKIVLLVLFFVAAFYCVYAVSKELSGGSIASLNQVISGANLTYLPILILVVVALFFSDALKYSVISKIIKGRFDYFFNVNVGLMGRFYDNITPFNTGGQVYQVYQYYQKGYSPSASTAIPIIKYIFQLVSWILVCAVLYIVNHDVLDFLSADRANVISIACYAGIALACFAPLLTILFSIFPNPVHRFIGFFIKIGCKLKLVKDFEKTDNKVLDFLTQYRESFLQINKNAVGIISLLILSALDFLLVMSVPYFVLLTFGGVSGSPGLYFDVITLNAYSLFAASLVPTPGNSGAIEAFYSMVFAPIPMGEGMLFWVVFIWRFCTYYIYILLGLAETLIKAVYNAATRKTRPLFKLRTEYRRVGEGEEDAREELRVLEVVDNYFPVVDGVVNVVDNLSRTLNKKVRCDVLVPWYPKTFDGGGYKVIRSKSMSGGKYGVRLPLPMIDFKMQKEVLDNKYDLIHAHSPVTLARFALRVGRVQNVPVVFSMHTRFHEEINRSVKIGFLRKFALNFLLFSIRRMDYIWAVSDGGKNTLQNDYGVKLPCEVVPNGTDIQPVSQERRAQMREVIRQKLSLKEDETVLLFVGRLVVVKNIQLLVKTAKILKDRGEKIRLVLVGEGDYRKELEALVSELDVADVVTFEGNIDDREELMSYYVSADVFVLPSTFDTCPLVVKEAEAAALPPMAVAGSASAEGIIDGHNGYLAPVDEYAWADKISEIVKNPQMHEKVREDCFKELYRPWQKVADEVLERYKQIIAAGKRNRKASVKKRCASPEAVENESAKENPKEQAESADV